MLQSYKAIMVAIDGSNEAEIAFIKAANVALRNEGTLLLAHVIDTQAFQNIASFDGVLIEQLQETARETLANYVKKAEKMGVQSIKTVIEYGSPKIIIAKNLPKEQGVDLIMLGATGLNAVERLFIGSVSEYVIRHAPCDVLIVRTDTDNKTPSIKK